MENNKIKIIKEGEIDLSAIFAVLLNGKVKIILIALLFVILGIFNALSQTILYKSTISIYPSENKEMSQMANLKSMASALGFNAGKTSTSLDIKDILYSQSIQKKIIYHTWNSQKWPEPINLILYWDNNNNKGISFDPLVWLKSLFKSKESQVSIVDKMVEDEVNAINKLTNRIEIKKNKSGLYNISVWMEEKKLSSDIANMIYDYLVDFNTRISKNNSKLNREFIQDRLTDVSSKLESAEENLKIFREKNRRIRESPQLQLELGRLSRKVELQNQLYITLLEQFELLKIKELDEIPTLSVLDNAVPALYKDKPKRKKIVLISLMAGIMIGVVFVFGQFWYKHSYSVN